jgi:hypothetical protein
MSKQQERLQSEIPKQQERFQSEMSKQQERFQAEISKRQERFQSEIPKQQEQFQSEIPKQQELPAADVRPPIFRVKQELKDAAVAVSVGERGSNVHVNLVDVRVGALGAYL